MKIYKIANNIKYFHGSYHSLPKGTILTPQKGNFMGTFSQDEMDSHFKLEQFKPPQYLSRNNSVFMTDNPDDIDNAGGASEHIYLVNPLGKIEKHDLNWMSEIDLIISNAWEIGQDEVESTETIDNIQKAALNYWNGTPHYNESLWEYLTTSAIILKEV